MNITNLFKIALRALANNKMRAFLTMVGIIIGVASVIAMLAIGQGSKASIQSQISSMGSNMIMIQDVIYIQDGIIVAMRFALMVYLKGIEGCTMCISNNF